MKVLTISDVRKNFAAGLIEEHPLLDPDAAAPNTAAHDSGKEAA